jgi:hypothetical protein
MADGLGSVDPFSSLKGHAQWPQGFFLWLEPGEGGRELVE